MDTITLPRLSASRIKLFHQCRKLYHWTYKEGQDQIQNPSAIRGSALHKAIEYYYKEGKNPKEVYEQEFDRLLAEAGSNIKVFGNISGIRRSGIDLLGRIDWPRIQPKDLEVRFELTFPKDNPVCVIVGFMDVVTVDGFIIDHKSNAKLPDADVLANDPQFVIYYWAYEQIYGNAPNGVIWHHLQTGTFHNTNVHKYINRKLNKLYKDIHAIRNEQLYKKKDNRDGFCKNICGLDTECWGK